jgi:hypothetical protein
MNPRPPRIFAPRYQPPVVSRGGIWDIIQSSIAARIATAAPMITCTVIAVVPWKPNTQGDTNAHKPTMRFSYSSHSANAASAAIARIAITRPVTWALLGSGVEAEHPGRSEQNRAKDPGLRRRTVLRSSSSP